MGIRQRLLNLARVRKEDYNFVLRQYVLQRLMYRLGISDYADDFLLKGGLLFWVWNEDFHRPTQDMDLLAFGSSDKGLIKEKFIDIIQIEVKDGLVFDPLILQISPIKEETKYQGVRLTGIAYLTKAKIPYQIDVGFGDAVKVVEHSSDIPAFLDDLPAPKLKVYPIESVIAEKFHAMVDLGLANSRMKDFFDVVTIANTMTMSFIELQNAIIATFKRRETDTTNQSLYIFTQSFKTNVGKHQQWKAFKKKNSLNDNDDFAETVNKVQQFLQPVYQQIVSIQSTNTRQWNNTTRQWE